MKMVLSVGLASLLFIGMCFGMEQALVHTFAWTHGVGWWALALCGFAAAIAGAVAAAMNRNHFFLSALCAGILAAGYWLAITVGFGSGAGVALPALACLIIVLGFCLGAIGYFMRTYTYSI